MSYRRIQVKTLTNYLLACINQEQAKNLKRRCEHRYNINEIYSFVKLFSQIIDY